MWAEKKENFTATRNACKLCSPLGASLVFKGIEGAISLLHGSQGCATYIRRYVISHFKEPIDIASSNFSEETAIFGGGANLKRGLANVLCQYEPKLIGIATTCLSETIGDDVNRFLSEYLAENGSGELPPHVHVSTPSYSGTHMDGFHGAVRSVVEKIAESGGETTGHVNVLPGMVSPEDLRHLKRIFSDFGMDAVLLPDYAKTLDGGPWQNYQKIPEGGTTVRDIRRMGGAAGTIEFGRVTGGETSAGRALKERFDVPHYPLGLPIGVKETDRFFQRLQAISGRPLPEIYSEERARLIDSYVDGHKYVTGARAVLFGEEDLVAGVASFLDEIGITPVLIATGGKSGKLADTIRTIIPGAEEKGILVRDGVDFMDIAADAKTLDPDLFIGSSKGYSVSRKLKKPIVRIGFPIHDRVGGARIRHLCYSGAQSLFDRVANAIITARQEASDIGYAYI